MPTEQPSTPDVGVGTALAEQPEDPQTSPCETVNHLLFSAIERFESWPMQIHRDRTWTYADVGRAVHGVALGLEALGVRAGDRVAIIAENSPRWIHAFLGIQALGAIAVPRGLDTPAGELAYILQHSGCEVAFVGTAAAQERIPDTVVAIPLYNDEFPEPVDLGAEELRAYGARARPTDLSVILYTSGTTGQPKGVMLEHRNLGHNLRVIPPMVDMREGDRFVSILPPWHTFELTAELGSFSVGCCTVYSDKRRLRDDLRTYRPHYFASVPRLWQVIYDGVHEALAKKGLLARSLFRAAYAGSRLRRRGNPLGLPLDWMGRRIFYRKMAEATGGRLKNAVSGGGALPHHVDEFFAIIGVPLLVGYGLTETSPVVAVRRPDDNVLGTIGRPLPDTHVRLTPHGTFEVRGPQVMRGYYRDEGLTRSVLSEDGWFDTGDLGRLTDKDDLIFVGRLKETIVLAGGENVEPEPIENRLLQSPLVHQVMLVGQDRKNLGALVVPDPDARITQEAMLDELRSLSGSAGGFRSFEVVTRCALLAEPFSAENGLMTPTLKLRRNVIADRFRDTIDSLYAQSRKPAPQT